MSQDTNVENLIINVLTKAQYESITPSATQIYLITDDVGITSSDIINALGYTPYNSTNPNNYTSNVGTVTSVNGEQPDSNGDVSIAIPTVNNGILTIQRNGTPIGTFTANQSGNSTVNIEADTASTDDITVSKNPDDELQAIGVIDNNSKNAYNFTVVGSPTITTDGIASGFSSSNYLRLPNSILANIFPKKKWKIQTGVVTITNQTTSRGILFISGHHSCILQIHTNRYLYLSMSSDGSTFDIANDKISSRQYEYNKPYIFTLERDENGYSLKMFDINANQEYTILTISSTADVYVDSDTNFPKIGYDSWYSAIGDTSIDLKQFSITVDEVEVYKAWQPPALKYWIGTKAQYDAIITKDPTTLYNVTDTEPSYSVNTQYKNIGAIVQSMVPLTDAGLHLMDGSLIQTGIYSEFVEYMAGLYGDGTNIPNCFCTETEWQASVSQYGSCGKFVYDSTNNTVRLPKITGIIEGTTDLSALGDLIEAGLPNITGIMTGYGNRSFAAHNVSGAFTAIARQTPIPVVGETVSGLDSIEQIGFDASQSNSIYGNSSTVQPQTIKAFYYIVIATSTKTDIQVDIDEIATDLNGKVDTDLTNVTSSAKELMAHMGMPSGRYIDLTQAPYNIALVANTRYSFTAPADGYLFFNARSTAANQFLGCFGDTLYKWTEVWTSISGSIIQPPVLPVRKGQTISDIRCNFTPTDKTVRFLYALGGDQ